MRKEILIISFFVVQLWASLESAAQQKSDSSQKTLDVTELGILANSDADQTEAIQQLIDEAKEGETIFFPEGTYLVRTIQLRTGVNLLSEGTIQHHPSAKVGEYSMEKQNSPNPLILGEMVENINISIKGVSKNEGIYLLKSHQISITNSDLNGDSTKLRAYSGIIAFESSGIEISNSRIKNFGSNRVSSKTYQPGTGIRILSCNTISIHDSEIANNGENGVFIYGSRKVEVIRNVIHHNGMSGIQVAFGDKGKEEDFNFTDNILDSNAADAIDINNRSLEKAKDISCVIAKNISCDNGFARGESTPDGSGIGTLINISNVILYKNEAYRNNRPALYVESCGLIIAKENWADNQVEVVSDLKTLILDNNRFSSVNLIANVKAEKITIKNNQLGSLSLPNGIQVKDFQVVKNSFSHATFNINMKGNLLMKENRMKNTSKNPILLIVKGGEITIEKNEIESKNSSAIILRNTADSVKIISNTISSTGPVIFDENSKNLVLRENKLSALGDGEQAQTFRTHYPRNLQMQGNTHIGKPNVVAVMFVGKGNANLKNENLESGTSDYGEVTISSN